MNEPKIFSRSEPHRQYTPASRSLVILKSGRICSGQWRETLVEHSGIEPLLVDWKPTVLTDRRMLHNFLASIRESNPVTEWHDALMSSLLANLHRHILVESRGIEPRTEACKATAFPITPWPQSFVKPTTVYRHSRDKSLKPSWCCHNRFKKWYSERVSIPLLRLERAAF